MPRFRYCELWSDLECNGGVREYLIPNRFLAQAGYTKAIDVPEQASLQVASQWFRLTAPPGQSNLSPRSGELDHAAWTKNRTTASADTDTAPDGTTTADRLIEDATASASHRAYSASLVTITDGANALVSRFLKAGTRSWALLGAIDNTESKGVRSYFDLTTGVVGSINLTGSGTSLVARGVVPYPDDWFRCWVLLNMGAGVTGIRHYLGMATGDVGANYSGDGASYIRAWGAQTENDVSGLRGYIKTEAGSVTITPIAPTPDVRKGKVIRFCTTDAAVFDEWRVRDVIDGNGPGSRVTQVLLDPISADGNRAMYTAFDATGAPYHDYMSADATAEQVIDDAVLPALADAGVDYAAKGDVEPENVFDFAAEAGETATAMLKRAADEDHANAETRWRRNGTTNYLIDVLAEIGSDAPVVHVRTRRNLERWRRHKNGALGFNRARPIGQDDGTHRGIGYAFWRVAARDTGADWIELEDPRGASYPNVIRSDNEFNDLYVHLLGPTLVQAQIIDTATANQRLTVADASIFPVGGYVEFRTGNTATSGRLWHLNDTAQQIIDGGVYLGLVEKKLASGAVNYMPDPFTADLFTNPHETTQTGTISTSTASDDVFGTGTAFTTAVPPLVGTRLVRESDSALIGVVAEVFDDETLRLEANALLTLTDEAFATQEPLPLGWLYTPAGAGDVAVLAGADAQTVPGATAFNAVFVSAGNATTTFETGIPLVNASLTWRIWCWLHFIGISSTVTVTVSLRRVDGTLIGTALTFNSTEHTGTKQVAEFVGQNISAATSGVRMRIVIAGTGSHSWNINFGPLGAMPSAWTRQDRYGPFVELGENACDLWHQGHEALIGLPEGYELELRDLERAGGLAAEELIPGGTLSVYDTDLDVTTLQRTLELHVPDVWQPLLTRVRVGTRSEMFAELVAKRTKPDTGDVGRALAAALSGAIDDEIITDGDGVLALTGAAESVGAAQFARAVVPVLTKSLRRLR